MKDNHNGQQDTVKISVIVPVFNSEPYLRECLDSLVNQTLKDIEIICAYDKCGDRSLSVLSEYAAKDERVKILVLEENNRLGAARNAGLRAARGDFVGFVDSDDWIELDMYEKLWKASVKAGGADISAAGRIYNNRGNERWIERHLPPEISGFSKEEFNRYVIKNASAPLWMLIVRKQLFFDHKLFFAEKMIHEDVPIAHALYCLANRTAIVDEPFYHYRVNIKSTSFKVSDSRFDLLATSVMYLENMKRLGLYETYREECEWWFYTRYYQRMIATCFFDFPAIRKDYIEKIKTEFPRYVENIYGNKYYRSRKITRFDVFLYLVNWSTGLACFCYGILRFLRVKKLLRFYKRLRGNKFR